MRRGALGALVLLAVVLLAVMGAWLFIRSPAGERLIRERVVAELNQVLPGNIELGGLDLHGQTIVLANLVLRDPEGNVVARIARVEATVKFLDLLHQELDITQARITRPELFLVLDDEGLNLLRAVTAAKEEAEEKSAGATFSVRLREVILEEGLVDFQQSTLDALAQHVRLEQLGVKAELDLRSQKEEIEGKVTLEGALTQPVQGPVTIALDGTGSPKELAAKLSLAIADIQMNGSMARQGTEQAKVGLDAVRVPPATARALFPAWPLTAEVQVEGTVVQNGNLATLALEAAAADATARVSGGIDLARLRAESLVVEAQGVDFAALVENGPESNLSVSLTASGGGTSLKSLDGQVDLTIPPSSLADQSFGPIELHATAKDGVFKISEVTADVPGASLVASGEGTLEDIRLKGKLRASDLSLLGRTVGRIVQPQGLPLSGSGVLSFELTGPPTHPGVTATGSFPSLRYDTISAGGLQLKGAMSDVTRPLDLDATVNATTLMVDDRRFRDIRAEVLTRGRALVADVSTRGFAQVTLHLAGTLDADRQGLAVADLQLRYPEATWTLQRPTHVAFGEGGFRLDELTLESGRQRLTVAAAVRGTKLEGRARVENLVLGALPKVALPDDLALEGDLDALLDLRGSPSRPVADLTATLRNGRIQSFEDLGLQLRGHYERDRASGELLVNAFSSTAKGNFDIPVSGLTRGVKAPLHVELAIEKTELQALFASLGIDPGLRGTAAATIRAHGTAADPRVRIVIDGDRVEQEAGPPGDLDLIVESGQDGKLVARIDLDTMGSESFLLLKTPFVAGQFLTGPVTGRMFLETPVELEAAFRDVPVEALRAWNVVAADMKGKASLIVKAHGPVLAPQGKVHLALKNAAAGTMAPFDAYGTVSANGETIDLTVAAMRGQERFVDLEGRFGASLGELFAGKAPEHTQLSANGDIGPVQLSELQALTTIDPQDEDQQRPNGLVKARLSVSGTVADPQAELKLVADRLGVGQVALGRVDLDYRYDDAVSKAKAILTSSQGGRLQLDAQTTLDLSPLRTKAGTEWKKAPIQARLTAKHFDPAFLSNVSEMVRTIGGQLDADATVAGTLGAPLMKGRLDWKDGSLGLMGFGQYRAIRLHLEGDNDSIALKELYAESGGGDARLSLRADRRGNEYAVTGEGELTRFPLISDDQLQAILSARLRLEGNASAQAIFIRDLTIPRAYIELPEVRRKDLQDLDRPEDIVLVRKGEPLYARNRKKKEPAAQGGAATAGTTQGTDEEGLRRYTVLVNAPRNIWIRGTDVNAEIGLSQGFRLTYSDRLLLEGEVRFLTGRVDVLGRRFDVLSDSQIRFNGPAALPYVNITAEHANEREQVAVFTTIRGQGKEVTLKVSSSPALSESEIYTLLATGRRTLKRGSGSSMTGAEAASVVGAYAASQVKKVLASKLPLDVLSIEAGAQGLADASVEAGTYLTDDIYLGVMSRLGADQERNENAAGFRLQYQFSPQWSLEGEYGTARSGGADVIWSRDF